MFVIVVLFLPKGIVGSPMQLWSLFKRSTALWNRISAQGGNTATLPLKESSAPPQPDAIRAGNRHDE
jgi:hypothetical protein